MIRTDSDFEYTQETATQVLNTSGHILKPGIPAWETTSGIGTQRRISYNESFGSTSMRADWTTYTLGECAAAGISTSGMSATDTKRVEVNIPRKNRKTVDVYNFQRGRTFFELYEKADERKARHKALRDAGYQPPFPRADRFIKNAHQGDYVQVGLTTEGSYTP
tara:strand:- start:1043 stop:1534 length:492 start_codon:yes stop_codon:yes gene_type:complete